MAMIFASINSGSNANCYYVGTEREAVLIDVGLSCRETEKRMQRMGLDLKKVKALFITHEHSDHITGLEVLSKKYKLPVYITRGTARNSILKIDPSLVNDFKEEEAISFEELTITPFKKSHDAADPHSFTVKGNDITIGVITDMGYACKRVIKHFKDCDGIFLESNYSEYMLENGSYPISLKKRIRGRKGHLSNEQALELFLKHRTEWLQWLILSHLSENNNRPEIVEKIFSDHAGKVKIIVASRYQESEIFRIESSRKKKNTAKNRIQLSLFE